MIIALNKFSSKFHNRDKLFFYSAASSLIAKGVNIIVSLLSLPLVYNCIGKERYGMMVTITSISALINFADLGLGFGLQNKIPSLLNNEDNSLHKLISSAFFFLLGTSIFILLLFLCFSVQIQWPKVFHLSSLKAISEVYISVLTFALCLTVVIPFSVVQKLQLGSQQGYLTNFWISGGNILGLIALYLAYINKASTPIVIICIYGSNAIFIIFNFVYEFFIRNHILMPNIHLVKFKLIKSIIGESFMFFAVQMLSILLFTANNAFLIYHYGPEKVTEFNIAYKLVLLFLLPLEASAPYITPAINEAIVNNDYRWVNQSAKKLMIISIILALATALTTFYFSNSIISIWINKDVIFSLNVLLSLAFFMLLYANLGCVLSYIMLSSKFIRKKAIFYSLAVFISIVFKFYMIKNYDVAGAFWSTTIPMFFVYVIPSLFILKQSKIL